MAPWSDKEECSTDHSLCPQLSDFYDENAALRACLEETEDAKTAFRARLEAAEQRCLDLEQDLAVFKARWGHGFDLADHAAKRAEAAEQQVAVLKEALEPWAKCDGHPHHCESECGGVSCYNRDAIEALAQSSPDSRILIDPAELERLRKVEKAASRVVREWEKDDAGVPAEMWRVIRDAIYWLVFRGKE